MHTMRRNFLVHGNRPGAEARIQRNFHGELSYPFPLPRNVFTGVVLTEKSPVQRWDTSVDTSDKNPR